MNPKPVVRQVILEVEAVADAQMRPTLILHNGPRTTRIALTWDESRELRAHLEAAERMAGLMADFADGPSEPVQAKQVVRRVRRHRGTKGAQRNSVKRLRQR